MLIYLSLFHATGFSKHEAIPSRSRACDACHRRRKRNKTNKAPCFLSSDTSCRYGQDERGSVTWMLPWQRNMVAIPPRPVGQVHAHVCIVVFSTIRQILSEKHVLQVGRGLKEDWSGTENRLNAFVKRIEWRASRDQMSAGAWPTGAQVGARVPWMNTGEPGVFFILFGFGLKCFGLSRGVCVRLIPSKQMKVRQNFLYKIQCNIT